MQAMTVTNEEKQKVLSNYFKQGLDGPLSQYPSKEKRKLIILEAIAGRFEAGTRYTEKEVNAVLQTMYEDFALIRRALIDYGFLARSLDCTEYWVAEEEQS
ncbi:DUF2087 domain-containing protein [Sporosarcina trichiuri]|uniref:DUF2087 domain-containing protein n=1 Tax=Sporosarcina trichiuri TaxID=3056445 RepID=UPI0025B40CC3|nr:DUF2087 domain-containing protein [Sporosarcina sp. 0.2-SM1T-5]WJY27325.1 DUF2087 domain-containing protein [Sporosarcina sp. 0.2-SM1T-5]